MIVITSSHNGLIQKVRATPKQKANDLIDDKLTELLEGYWIDSYRCDGMTKSEINLVTDQIIKQVNRIQKNILGFRND